MKREKTKNQYTLLEFLIAGSLLLFLLTFMITFFNKGTKVCKYFSEKAHSNKQIMVIKNKWRKFINKSDFEFLSIGASGNKFESEMRSVEFKNNHIIFVDLDKTESYGLSKNMKISFDIDYSTKVPLIIMNITLSSRFPGEKDENVRIVACPKERI